MIFDTLADARCTLTGTWLPGTDEPVFPIGEGYSDRHQQEMFEAIRGGDAEAILNTNPTGGGKTLSWAAAVIRSQEDTTPLAALATYPTRALIEDQRQLLLSYFRTYFEDDHWAPKWTVREDDDGVTKLIHDSGLETKLADRVHTVTGADIDDPESTGAAFRSAERSLTTGVENGLPSIVLTTPDALTLLATGRYSDKDLGALPALVDCIVVDEFHLTSPRGKRLLPFHLDTYLSLGAGELQQLIFLSATPQADYTDRINRAFDTRHVSRTVHSTPPDTGRQILPAAEFGVTNRSLFQTGEWLADQTEAIEKWVAPPGQTLIIVDSVREVDQLADTLATETNYEVGRVYGWKKHGRATAIESADILVGNTAVEVGVDFERVNRLIFTAHEPNSALQRLGRMRIQSAFDEYQILCVTTPAVQDAIIETMDGGKLTRSQLEEIYLEQLSQPGATLPYEDLCAAYTRYLWSEATPSLNEMYVPAEAKTPYQELVHTHFGSALEQLYDRSLVTEASWDLLSESPYLSREAILQEMHTYRSSSLGCLVIDPGDSEEPLKQYNLQHVLRYRRGEIIEKTAITDRFEDVIGRGMSQAEQAYVGQMQPYIECGFITTGSRSEARNLGVHELGWTPSESEPETLQELRLTVSPPIEGLERLNPLSTDVLVYYSPVSPRLARDRYQLGPYTNLLPCRDGTIFLWEDALLAHTSDLATQL